MTTLNVVEMEAQGSNKKCYWKFSSEIHIYTISNLIFLALSLLGTKWFLRKMMTEVHDIARGEETAKLSNMMKNEIAKGEMLITLKIRMTGEETHVIGIDNMKEVRSAEKMRGMYDVKEVHTGKVQKITQKKMGQVMEEKGTVEMRVNTVEDTAVKLVINIGGMTRSMIRTMDTIQATDTSGTRESMKRGS